MIDVGRIFVVGLGPGHRDLLTPQAVEALRQAKVVIGYSGYFAWVEDLIQGKERLVFPLGAETERAEVALQRARKGCQVAVISSGDPGIYAMASLVLETTATLALDDPPEIVIVPGVSALTAAAALLGAPLGHDFGVISLSDLLTPWERIEKRLAAAAEADFVIVLFNPKSQQRDWQLGRARDILRQHRVGTTPVGIVKNAYRPGQTVCLTTLEALDPGAVDMFSIVFVGNSMTRTVHPFMLTPRGYEMKRTEESP